MSQSPSSGALGHGFQPPRPPMAPPASDRYSATAITALVAALVPCCYIHVLVSLICSALGLAATAGGRARGRGLALTAIPIAVLMGVLETGVFWGFYKFGASFLELSVASSELLKHSGAELDEAAASFYDEYATPTLKGKVSREQFQSWAQAVVARHGTLVEFEPPQSTSRMSSTPRPDGSYVQPMELRAKFVNGTQTLSMDVALKWAGGLQFEFLIDDISVGGLAASSFTQGQSPDSSPPVDDSSSSTSLDAPRP